MRPTVWLALIGTAVVLGSLMMASTVFAPAAFALFLIALIWPVQKYFEARIPRPAALIVTTLIVLGTLGAFVSIIGWGVSRVARWLIANIGRFQALYDRFAAWLEEHGIAIAVLWSDQSSMNWILGAIQRFSSHANTTITFWIIVLLYVFLGLLEADVMTRRIRSLPSGSIADTLIRGSAATAGKWRRFMAVRTVMSLATGVLVWLLTAAFGLPLAREWGVMAFALNYIPIIGPFFATILPALVALVHLDSWQAVAVVVTSLCVIQLVVGSYVEPRVSGSTLAMSPTIVLFSIFLWTYVWGLAGTVLGVPIAVALLSFCALSPSTRWLPVLFGALDETEVEAPGPAGRGRRPGARRGPRR